MSQVQDSIAAYNKIGEISKFLEKAIAKTVSLTSSSFGKFTASHLPDDYLYNKWIGKKKDFADVYLNMDNENQRLFIKYVMGENEHDFLLSQLLHQFFLFCWNYDSGGWTENPFAGKYKDKLIKAATGKVKPQSISAMQVVKLFLKLDTNGKNYLTWCVFGKKQSEK